MMEGKVLAQEILSAIKSSDPNNKDEIWQNISDAIVKFLITNAQVMPSALLAPPLGGPVTGVGKLQ